MKVIKPLSLGVLFQPYRYQGQSYLAIVTLGFFRLGADNSRLLIENLQWPKVLPALPAGEPLDYILPRRRAQAVVFGAAYPPADQAVTQMEVGLQVGSIAKRLRVMGARRWAYSPWPFRRLSDTQNVQITPLDYRHTFGGETYLANPQGQGYLPSWARMKAVFGRAPVEGDLPPVEYAAQPLKASHRQLLPASLAPQSLLHALPQAKRGTFGAKWLAEDFPGLPDDFDWSLYSLAPLDQQFEGAFVGGEAYRLSGLHPTQTVLEGALPSLRGRAFVLSKNAAVEALQEVPLVADMVSFFPHLELGVMAWRGHVPVQDSDALDLATLMIAYESSTTAARSLAHYREVLALRLDPATAALHAFNESQLAPERSAAEHAQRAALRAAHVAAEQTARQQRLDAVMADFWSRSKLDKPQDYVPPIAAQPLFTTPARIELEEGDFDLSILHAEAMAVADKAKQDAEQKRREAEAQLAAAMAKLPEHTAPESPESLFDTRLRQAATPAWDLQAGGVHDAPLPEALQAALDRAMAAKPDALDEPQVAQVRAALAQLPAQQRAGRRAAQSWQPSLKLNQIEGEKLGQQVLQWVAEGVCLAGRDLSGAVLRGANLRGVDWREVLLEGADLRGADLRAAQLAGAVLLAANLDGAKLQGAQFEKANLCASHARRATFSGANFKAAQLNDAVWSEADLTQTIWDDALALRIDLCGANLQASRLHRTVLMGAVAVASQWRDSEWWMSVAASANLQTADFSLASLKRSVLLDAQLQNSRWQGANLESVYAGGKADWQGAQMRGMLAQRSGWHGADLRAADLRDSRLIQCDFGFTQMAGACLASAQLHRSRFMASDLQGVDAQGASFLQAMCRKTDFRDADLRHAIFVQAETTEMRLEGAQMDGARVPVKASLQ